MLGRGGTEESPGSSNTSYKFYIFILINTYMYKILITKQKLGYINGTYDKGAIFLLYKSLYKST